MDGKHQSDDESNQNMPEDPMAELFAEAVTRLEEGESIDSVLTGFTKAQAAELHGMLLVSQTLLAWQRQPLPVRNPQRLGQRRTEFLNQIALERVREEVSLPLAQRPSPLEGTHFNPVPSSPPKQVAAPRGPASWWATLQNVFTVGQLRLAPIVVTLVAVFASAFGVWRVSSASLPGDLTYPIKAWVQMLNLNLTSPDQLEAAAQSAAGALQADIAESALRAQERATAGAAPSNLIHQETVYLVFDGYDGRLLKFGDLRVIPSWQKTADSTEATPIEVTGDLQPGSPVWLTIQILPGQADVVQGVRAQVESAPVVAQPQITPVTCSPRRPAGWAYYTVERGDTLSALAAAGGGAVRDIARANCLESDLIVTGQLLFVPAAAVPAIASNETPDAQPSAAVGLDEGLEVPMSTSLVATDALTVETVTAPLAQPSLTPPTAALSATLTVTATVDITPTVPAPSATLEISGTYLEPAGDQTPAFSAETNVAVSQSVQLTSTQPITPAP